MSRGSRRRARDARLRALARGSDGRMFIRSPRRPPEGPVAQGTSPVTINPLVYERLDRVLGWVEFPDVCRYDAVWLGQYLVKFNEYNEMLAQVVEAVVELLEDAGMVVTLLGDRVLVE